MGHSSFRRGNSKRQGGSAGAGNDRALGDRRGRTDLRDHATTTPQPLTGQARSSGTPLVWNAVAIAAAAAGSATLFFLELVAGKILLPRFGGAPGVWVSCLAFFQVALVAATLYADRVIRLRRPRLQLVVQALMFATATALAPIGFVTGLALAVPESSLPLPLLVVSVLALGVGPVFFAVATLAPIFGHWRAHWPDADHTGHAAYRLYAAGNAGSFAMLAAYPTLIEPIAGIGQQIEAASRLFLAVGALMLVVGAYTALGLPAAEGPASTVTSSSTVTVRQWLTWAFYAAIPASWLSAVTTHATVEIAPIPLLWIVPLAIYLASFVVVFTRFGRRLARYETKALVIATGVSLWMLVTELEAPPWLLLTLHMTAFGTACLCIHGLLVDRRPPAQDLSTFYMALAVGGACGGLWTALVAPAIFDAHHEFPLAIAVASALVPPVWQLRPKGRLVVAGVLAAFVGGTLLVGLVTPVHWWFWLGVVAIAVVVPALTFARGERAMALVTVALVTFFMRESASDVVYRHRTFFGVVRVCESSNGPAHVLMHGGIRHGEQLVSQDPDRRRIPLTYYAEAGPLGSIFHGLDAIERRKHVGIAGLGVGTVASYARPDDNYVFFEIDRSIARLARDPHWFTFLSDCRGKARVVIDDARRAIENEPDGSFDLLIIDAFTGDSVPTHLLTREAFALYRKKLHPQGAVALHVSNKYLDFVPVVEAVAHDGGWMGVYARDLDLPEGAARTPSEWMALSQSLETIQAIYATPTSASWRWTTCSENPTTRPWTDDRTAVIEALLARSVGPPKPLPPADR